MLYDCLAPCSNKMCSIMNYIIIFWIIIATHAHLVKYTGLSCCIQLGLSLDCSDCNLILLPTSLMDNGTIDLNLSNNNITVIPEGSFENMTFLRRLDLSHNPLQMQTRDSFKGLDLLEHLVMEDEHWSPSYLFANLKNLKTLSSNYLYPTELQPTSLNLTHLISLKIAANKEGFLGEEFKIIKKLSFLTFNMSNNRFDYSPMAALNNEGKLKECAEDRMSLLTVVLTVVSLLCFVAVTFVMVHRLKWQLRWCVSKTQKNMLGAVPKYHGDNLPVLPVKQFDAFISYNHTEDYQWVVDELFTIVEEQWGFTLCLGQKDFIAGKPITENIIDAVENSRRTILVVTPGFAESEWCEFEMQMALVKGRDFVVIIYKEEVPVNKMSKTLRWLMRSINYIEYIEDAVGQKMFWEKLRNTLERI